MSLPSPQIIDVQAIENLRSLGEEGDDSFLKDIIGIYLEDLPERIAALKTALATDNRALYTRSAHTIKGSSANVGATEVLAIATSLENRSKQQDPLANLNEELIELEAACERACKAFKTLIS